MQLLERRDRLHCLQLIYHLPQLARPRVGVDRCSTCSGNGDSCSSIELSVGCLPGCRCVVVAQQTQLSEIIEAFQLAFTTEVAAAGCQPVRAVSVDWTDRCQSHPCFAY
jgi:hypothetical protein